MVIHFEPSLHNLISPLLFFTGLMISLLVLGLTIGLLAKLIGHIGLIIIASILGWTIGPPAAIEYAVEPVDVDMINPSPIYSLTFSLSISICIWLVGEISSSTDLK